MGRWEIRAFLVCLAVCAAQVCHASCAWFADDDAIHRVDTDSNQIVASARLRDPHRLVPNIADCGVWALHRNERKLSRSDESGQLPQELRVRDIDGRIDDVDHLQPDPFDDSLWLSDQRRIIQISATGQPIGARFNAPGAIRRLVVGLDQSLWVLGRRHVWNLDRAGNLKAEYPLTRHLATDARHFAVDALNGVVWLGGEREIAQFQIGNFAAPPLRIALPPAVTAFTTNPLTGQL